MATLVRGDYHSPKAVIDDVRVCHRALSGGEVKALFDWRGDDASAARAVPPSRGARAAGSGGAPVVTAPTGGLVGHWKLDEGKGGVAKDSSGKGNDATINGATWAKGRIGRSLMFDGENDCVDLPGGFADFRRGITVALWARPEAVGKWARFIELSNGRDNDNIVLARRDRTNDLSLHVYAGPKGGDHVTARGVIELGKSRHFAAVADGSGKVVLYRNGHRVGSGKTKSPRKLERTVNRLGKSSWPNDEDDKGLMDDFRICNRALSADEIRKLSGPT